MSKKPRFKIVTDLNGVDSLTDATGKPVPCIYSNPTALPHPTIAGQVIIHQKACNSLCQAFKPGVLSVCLMCINEPVNRS